MKYLDEYRDESLAKKIVAEIRHTITRPWVLMEVCGGQTHTIVKYGIDHLLPEEVELVHGPGCPVCVTSLEMIDKAHAIARRPDVIFCSFGDMLRVPGSDVDLLVLKSRGADVRVVYSPIDCLKIARANPRKKVVFFAIGFETTAPGNAMAVWQARQQGITNFSVLVSHVLVPPAMSAILESPNNRVQGFLGPGHVCTVVGYREYEPLAERYHVPIVVTGFEPIDILEGTLMTIRQLENGEATVENQYPRIVQRDGNPVAQGIVEKVFEVCDRKWRGIGSIPQSGYRLREEFHEHDAERIFEVQGIDTQEPAICMSGLVLQGIKKPHDCPAFGTLCTPDHPLGATMVSAEGACAAYYAYGRHLENARSKKGTGPRVMRETHADAALAMGSCPLPISDYKEIVLAHGSGEKLSQQLMHSVVLPRFRNAALDALHDGAMFSLNGMRCAFSTDSYVVSPIFFPGGDIGKLAIHGTVNDLAMCGAKPQYFSVGFILEEGLPMGDFRAIVNSMQEAAEAAGVQLVTGDTKVVDRGKADKVFINTAGIGVIPDGVDIHPRRATPGDKVIISGTIAVHGIAIMSVREGLQFETEIASDTAPLNGLVESMLRACPDIHVLRDPTRGGVSSALTEIAQSARAGILLDEAKIPISEEVKGACEILGLDPLYVANEGKLLAIVPPEGAEAVLAAMQSHPLGAAAAIIGEVIEQNPGFVIMKTRVGGTRVVDMLSGEQLPRIC